MELFLQQIIAGLISGSIYSLVAIGIVMIYKSTEIINFAQGESFMLGAYFAFLFYAVLGWPYPFSFISAILLAGFVGILLERVAVRPLIHRNANMNSIFMLTIAISASLKASTRLIGGEFEKPFPPAFSTSPLNLSGVPITRQQILILCATLILMIILAVFFKYSKLGKAMRGTSVNRYLARLSGIRVSRIFSLTWCLASVLGAVAGVLVAPVILIYPDMGAIIVKAIAACVIGGLTSIAGAVLGGFIIGLLENIGGGYLSTSLTEITAFVAIILFLALRPSGLFGSHFIRRV